MGVNIDEIDCNSSCKITNLPTPTANYDAATIKYVDDSVVGAGGGDMAKATYDTDNDGRVDAAESINDGTHSATAANIEDAVTKKHTQGSDTTLGSMSQAINMNNHKIINVADPTSNQDAATKKYVDDHVGGGSGSGDMLKSVYDTNNDGIVDKAEAIDNGTYSATAMQIAGAVITKHIQGADTTIGPMTDDIDMDGNTITNLATPVANSDAVHKAYVDNLVPLFNHIDVVTASRTDDTVYQNTTGKPMLVTILCDMYQTGSAREWCRLDIGATSSPNIYASYFRLDKDDITGSIDSRVTLTAIVPPGWYYQYVKGGDDVSVYKWYEQY
jgi:hypothetical protein